METKLKKILASILQIDSDDLTEHSSMATILSWDSLKQMVIISSLEEEFGIEFDEDDWMNLNSYQKLSTKLTDLLNK